MKKLILISAMILSVSLIASAAMVTSTVAAVVCQPIQKAKPAVPGVSPAMMDDAQPYTPATEPATTNGLPSVSVPPPASGGTGEYWNTFYQDYKKLGIDQTAVLAIKEGVQPATLMQYGTALKDLNPQNLIKAMYCAGYKGDDIKKASDQFNVSELVLVAGFKKSQEECRDQVTDTQAYTAVAAPTMAGMPSPALGSFSYESASPSTF